MSYFQPFIDLPYPNFVAEQAAAPSQVGQVQPVEPVQNIRAVEPVEEIPPDAFPTAEDVTSLSAMARSGAQAVGQPSLASPGLGEIAGLRNNRALRELVQSFANYDNSAAVARYDTSLGVFSNYSLSWVPGADTDSVQALRAGENAAYQALGISYGDNLTRELREGMSREIDRWYVGEGVFSPLMLRFTSSDGFRFTPLSDEAQEAFREAEILASYNRRRIAAYLREMARLTPEDFLFSDPTELDALALEQRRQFLLFMDRLLEQAGIDARAAELRYAFDAENRLDLARLDLAEDERLRLARLGGEISGYYGALRESVKQYDAGIISASLASPEGERI